MINEDGEIDPSREVIYKSYKTNEKYKTDDLKGPINKRELCEVIYNKEYNGYIPKCLANATNILKADDVFNFNQQDGLVPKTCDGLIKQNRSKISHQICLLNELSEKL